MKDRTLQVGAAVSVEHWPENEAVMGFRVFERTAYGTDVLYRDRRDSAGVEMTDDVEHAEVFMSGSVKWDGCINFDFPASKDCMIHACGKADVKAKFTESFDLIYSLAAEQMPGHRKELGQW